MTPNTLTWTPAEMRRLDDSHLPLRPLFEFNTTRTFNVCMEGCHVEETRLAGNRPRGVTPYVVVLRILVYHTKRA